SVAGDEARGEPTSGQGDDGGCTEEAHGLDGCGSNGVLRWRRARVQVVEDGDVVVGSIGEGVALLDFSGDADHGLDGEERVAADGRLTREHDRVGAVED